MQEQAAKPAVARVAGAEDGEDFALSSSSGADEDNLATTTTVADARRAARAAGHHPLQQNLRAVSAQLLLKRGEKPSQQSMQQLEAAASNDDESVEPDSDPNRGYEEGVSAPDKADSHDVEGAQVDPNPSEDGSADVILPKSMNNAEGISRAEVPTQLEAVDKAAEAQNHENKDGSIDVSVTQAIVAELDAAEDALLQQHGGAQTIAVSTAAYVSGSSSDEGSARDDASRGDDGMLALLQKAIALKEQAAAAEQQSNTTGVPAQAASSQPCSAGHDNGNQPSTSRRAPASAPDAVSFTSMLPQSYDEFSDLATGLSGQQLCNLLDRMRSLHRATLDADNKVQLQQLYSLTMQHFAAMAREQPLQQDVLDALTSVLASMTAEVPLYAAIVARARLAAMHKHFSFALQTSAYASLSPGFYMHQPEPMSALRVDALWLVMQCKKRCLLCQACAI